MLSRDVIQRVCLAIRPQYLFTSIFGPCTPGEVELLGLSVRGQIQRITLPLEKEDTGLSKMPSTQVGRSVRDLLSAIGDVCDR